MKSRTAASAMALICAMTMGLAACGQGDAKGGADGKTQVASPAANDKLAAYTTVFNTLIGDLGQIDAGLVSRADTYLKSNIASASPDDAIELDAKPQWLVKALADLKTARAMRGDESLAAVDRAADSLIAIIDKIVRIEGGLEGYYETRAYKSDNLARGKAADPELRQAYQDAITAMTTTEDVLSVAQRQANDARAEEMRKRGYVAEASLLQAMSRAELMATAIQDEDKPAARRAADDLETALADMRQNKSRLKSKDDVDSYDLVAKSLTDALAAYRDSLTGDAHVGEYAVIGHYNNAVLFSSQVKVPG